MGPLGYLPSECATIVLTCKHNILTALGLGIVVGGRCGLCLYLLLSPLCDVSIKRIKKLNNNYKYLINKNNYYIFYFHFYFRRYFLIFLIFFSYYFFYILIIFINKKIYILILNNFDYIYNFYNYNFY